jgi:hypothetical protein
MEMVYGELATIAAIWAVAALLMIPVMGLTLRHTVPPILAALARSRAASESEAPENRG